jgi:hypothetical protein
VAAAAAGLVTHRSADENDGIAPGCGPAIDEPLRPAGFSAAFLADGVQLYHMVGEREEGGHKPERLPAEVLVQAGGNDIDPAISEMLTEVHDAFVEELNLLDPYHLYARTEPRLDVIGIGGRVGFELNSVMSPHNGRLAPRIEGRLKNLHREPSVHGASHAPDQLLCLSREH